MFIKIRKEVEILNIFIAVMFIIGLIFENVYYYLNIKKNLNMISLPILTLVLPVLGLISMGIGVELRNISSYFDILILIIHLLLIILFVFVTIYVFIYRKKLKYKVIQIFGFILILTVSIPFAIVASSVVEVVSVVYILFFIPRTFMCVKWFRIRKLYDNCIDLYNIESKKEFTFSMTHPLILLKLNVIRW